MPSCRRPAGRAHIRPPGPTRHPRPTRATRCASSLTPAAQRQSGHRPRFGRLHELRHHVRDGRHDRLHAGERRDHATVHDPALQRRSDAYAGQTINVDLFDIGDVGGGAAYVGLQEPDGATWATANSMTDLGASLAGANPPSGGGTVTSLGTWPGSGGGSCTRASRPQAPVVAPSTRASGCRCRSRSPRRSRAGWHHLRTANCYWNLVYDVSSAAIAGDTFSVEVGLRRQPGPPAALASRRRLPHSEL